MFKKGDRVDGLYHHRNKSGMVIESTGAFTKVRWDGSKHIHTIMSYSIKKSYMD